MKGLTIEEYKEILEFVQEHHRFALYIEKNKRIERKLKFPNLPSEYGFGIKYVDSCYDSRDKSIWSIKFRVGSFGVSFSTNHYNALNMPPPGWKYHTLYDLCMAYLTGEFEPTDEFLIRMNF